jgi:glycine hydroxymethyltransferase
MHVIAAKAVAFGEALRPDFRAYAAQVVANAKALGEQLVARGHELVTGGTDTHLVLVDLRRAGVTGKAAEASLERAGLTCNKNGIPYDPLPPAQTSGIRLGSPAGTTRGFREAEFRQVANLIADVLEGLRQNPEDNAAVENAAHESVRALCARFPLYAAGLPATASKAA